MPSMIVNAPNWIRTAEILYRGQENTGTPLNPEYVLPTNQIFPGYVGMKMNGMVQLADQSADDGAYFGIFLSEMSTILDESQGGTIPPVLVRGPATMYVWNSVLNNSVPFAVEAAAGVDLVAVAGQLKVRGSETGPTVATLTRVLADRIEIELNAPGRLN